MGRFLNDVLSREQVFKVVREQVLRICGEYAGLNAADIDLNTSLTTDLGFDSISMVEVATAVEQVLEIEELALAAWSDQEAEQDGERFTMASLVELCLQTPLVPQRAAGGC